MLVVVTSFEVLELDEAGVGLLYAAVGVGGLVGGFVALLLSPGGHLARDFALGLALFGLPLALIGGLPVAVIAVVGLAVIGIGNSIVDVNALTIMQRAVPDDVLGRALGALDGLLLGTLGLGAVLAPVLIDLLGIEGALVATGALLPVLALVSRPRLRALDDATSAPTATGLLRRVPMLAGLPEAVLERLAREATAVRFAAGTVILREGDPGDRFYVVESGEVAILGRRFGPGEAFGEIALLRDVPRTATATAVTDVGARGARAGAVRRGGHGPCAERRGGRCGDRRPSRLVQRRERPSVRTGSRRSASSSGVELGLGLVGRRRRPLAPARPRSA